MFINSSGREPSKGISQSFIREMNERLSRLKEITDENGMELPSSLLTTARELSENAAQRSTIQYDYSDSSYQSPHKSESYIGVPSPQDFEKNSKDLSDLNHSFPEKSFSSGDSSSSDESMSTTNLKQKSKNLLKGVKQQLKNFRSTQNEYLKGNIRAETEAASYQKELFYMKRSASEVLQETSKTKRDLIQMREQLDNACELLDAKNVSSKPEYTESDISSIKANREIGVHLNEQIKELKKEIDEMNRRIVFGESEIKQKETENMEIKDLINKLKENVGDREQTRLEEDEISISCKSCILF
ncbi:unnamed protein product [Blepharisma stoltei]|uniref:Uncharacterized protein n=1 Tax=Blepharisma stoltei TaxID=1481888 RepID=A0AAU9JD34_9CILI|nr:unnamed protein product [Blepharisma stoltei]